MGVPLREKSYIFGDNESVVNSATQPYAKLHKQHNVLSFHRVQEAIASGVFVFTHIPGENNPADILSKHWGYSSVWHMLRAIMFIDGETVNAPGRNDKTVDDSVSINTVRYRSCKCIVGYVGRYIQGAAHSVVHRDRGVTTFWKEWTRQSLLQYVPSLNTLGDSIVCAYLSHMTEMDCPYLTLWGAQVVLEVTWESSLVKRNENVIWQFSSYANVCDSEFFWHHDCPTTIREDYSTRPACVLMSTTRYIEVLSVLTCTMFNTEKRLCNLENSNVIRDDTREEENYQSLTAKYLDQ
jgi:hypothetical protein